VLAVLPRDLGVVSTDAELTRAGHRGSVRGGREAHTAACEEEEEEEEEEEANWAAG
jgi:hypothetical protein